MPYYFPDYPPNAVSVWRKGRTVGMPPAHSPLVALHESGWWHHVVQLKAFKFVIPALENFKSGFKVEVCRVGMYVIVFIHIHTHTHIFISIIYNMYIYY